jgi:hypothetical protein
MDRTTKGIGAGLLLLMTALHAGCGSGASGLTAASLAADTPGISNEDPMARPIQVAWTSARAQRCGFNFDTAKMRSNYLGYEQRQGAAGEQLIKIQNSYDTTFRTISGKVSSDADYCTDKRSNLIKADLQRHLAGDYKPNLPQPAKAEPQCGGLFGGACDSGEPDRKFDSKEFYDELEKRKNKS